MTLVVLGHDFEQDWSTSWDEGQSESKSIRPAGLFVVADSAITSSQSGQTLLGGFRKVYPIPIKLWKPYFVGAYFHSYQTIYLETECFVAIAGSTLTAQHIINAINEHLTQLRITFIQNEQWGVEGSYRAIMPCEDNPLLHNAGVDTWDEDMFHSSAFAELLNAEQIGGFVHHCVNAALSSAKNYKLDEKSLNEMRTDIALGITCPTNGTEHLFTYRMKWEIRQGKIEVFAEMDELKPNQIAVLGMRKFENDAQLTLDAALKNKTSPAAPMFEFLNSVIDKVSAAGSFEIDRPSYLKTYRGGRLKHVKSLKKE